MDTHNFKSDLAPPSSSCSSESTSSTTSSKPAAKSRAAPTSNQDGASPQKRSRSDIPQTPSSNTASTLPLISLEHDDYTDGDYKSLDDKIINSLRRMQGFDQEPDLCLLLTLICLERRLITLTLDNASELLEREPSMEGILRKGWRAGSFKEVRQLGMFPVQQFK